MTGCTWHVRITTTDALSTHLIKVAAWGCCERREVYELSDGDDLDF